MDWFKNLNIGKKIITGYIVMTLITLLTAYIGIQNIQVNTTDTSTTFIIGISVIALVLSVLIGGAISGTISKPLVKLSKQAVKLSKGDTSIEVDVESQDEIGELSKSLNETVRYIKRKEDIIDRISNGDVNIDINIESEQDILSKNTIKLANSIELVMTELQNMSREHNVGSIDVFIDEDKFEGAHREVVTEVNEMIKIHLNAMMQAMGCIDEFAKGNFNAEIEKFPGQKIFINNAVEGMRTNLKEINSEVNDLVKSASSGNLSDRVDTNAYEGDWSVLMTGLNTLIDEILEPINEASRVLEEIALGNLNIKVVGDYKGDHAKIKDTLNNTIDILSGYIEEISYTLRQIGNSDLTVTIDREYIGDFADIKTSFDLIISSLNEVMGEINFASEQVSGGAKQVSDSSQALSQASAEQASSVEEITSSIEQVAAQTKQNAINANDANELSTQAELDAEEGNRNMEQMVKSMEDINESSANISNIIKVIDDIAFQTNLLALNAAVEAARAGEHGKGFAVVAEEVRSLAARSADAAKETTIMIEDSIKTTEVGTNMAHQTARSLQDILEEVSGVSELVADIASASNEQATAVSQVNQAIDQVSTVTQMNTSTSEESAAASEQLSGQAEMLKEMVGEFRLKDRYQERARKSQTKHRSNNTNKKTDYNIEKDNQNNDYEDIEISLDDSEFGKYS